MKDAIIWVFQIAAVIFIFYLLLRILHRRASSEGISQQDVPRKTKRSFVEFCAALISSAYSAFLLYYFYSLGSDLSSSIATAIVTPHILCCVLGAIFMWIGFFSNSKSMALTGSILYCVAAVIFLTYAPLTIPSIILGFIGYSRVCKIASLNSQK